VHSDADGKFVWQYSDDRVKRRRVETGDTRDGRVLIRRGVSAGERVVVDPPADLQEDTLVRTAP
jgi:multidrug efflux pump subunit AcrA (membrane-fusion protein)